MLRRHEAFVDAAVPVLVGAVIVAGEVLHGGHSVRPAAILLGLAAAATLFARRRSPGWTLGISGVLVAVLFHVDRSASTVAVLAPAVALYSLALTRGRRAQLLAALAAVGAVLLADVLHSGRPGVLQTLGHVMLVAIPLLAAEQVRTHRAYLRLLEERLALAERTREQEAARRAEQERLRIARELHDVVAHTLTEINVQASSSAERTPAGDARAALETIEQSSHEAIGELRAILGVLRDPEGPEPPRVPSPGIENIPELSERAGQAGLEVELDMTGERPPRLSDAVSLAAYRIVQESLTNARRHAPGAPVAVHLHYDTSLLRIAIDNPLRATPNSNGATRSGVGITGMNERATALGGTLHTATQNGRFHLHAELPYEPGR
ncbi:MAG: sensor histidine kinase [Solirubrobacteraceae bacterium]